MRLYRTQQGTIEWAKLRMGIPTASCFGKILTPKTMRLSSQLDAYICDLLLERVTQNAADHLETIWTERGKEEEESALRLYEMVRGVEVERVGFAKHDKLECGCSPDGLVGEDGGVETKVRAGKTHLSILLGMKEDSLRPQVQGSLWITGRKWWDMVLWHPKLPPKIVRHERDEEYIQALDAAVRMFLARLEKAQARLDELMRSGAA